MDPKEIFCSLYKELFNVEYSWDERDDLCLEELKKRVGLSWNVSWKDLFLSAMLVFRRLVSVCRILAESDRVFGRLATQLTYLLDQPIQLDLAPYQDYTSLPSLFWDILEDPLGNVDLIKAIAVLARDDREVRSWIHPVLYDSLLEFYRPGMVLTREDRLRLKKFLKERRGL